MNKKITIIFLPLICGMILASCNGENNNTTTTNLNTQTPTNSTTQLVTTPDNTTANTTTPTPNSTSQISPSLITSVAKTYTVTWQNYDGTVLEIDDNVVEGTIPTYDGATPQKEGTDDVKYIFNGWTPSVSEVISDATYIAKFKEVNSGDLSLNAPILSNDGKTVQYGIYPQTVVTNTTLINALNTLQPSVNNKYYLYEDTYYVKVTSSIFSNETYTFNNGNAILNNTEYWFECNPITWNVLSASNGTYYLLSSVLLDVQKYYDDYTNRIIDNKTVYANNYEYSDIRKWLNEDFYNDAFILNNHYIQSTALDNKTTTNDSNNKYISNNTTDKVYLPSYQDYLNYNYGFGTTNTLSSSRECKTTDYTRAIGAWCSKEKGFENNGTYWTRSPSSLYYYTAWNVNSGGYISNYAVDGNSHCVRPAITINL